MHGTCFHPFYMCMRGCSMEKKTVELSRVRRLWICCILYVGMPEQNFNFSCHIKQSFEIKVWV